MFPFCTTPSQRSLVAAASTLTDLLLSYNWLLQADAICPKHRHASSFSSSNDKSLIFKEDLGKILKKYFFIYLYRNLHLSLEIVVFRN